MKSNFAYQSSALIGLNYFLKYLKEKDEKYLQVIKENESAIKFFALITLLQNNHELIFDEVDPNVVQKLFEANKIDDNFYDFGVGIKTTSKLDYLLQLKLIRNAIAHNSYAIKDNIIKVVNHKYNYEAIFDYKWLEATIICTLTSRNDQFKSGLYDVFLASLNDPKTTSKETIYHTLDNNACGLIKVTSTTNSLQRACNSLKMNYHEGLTFNDFFHMIKDILFLKISMILPKDISKVDDKLLLNAINKAIKDLNNMFEGSFKLEYIPFTKEFNNDNRISELFNQLTDYKSQLEFLLNLYKNKHFPELDNSMGFNCLLEFFTILDNNMEFDTNHQIYFDTIYNLIIKSMGNLVFSSILYNVLDYQTFSKQIFYKYQDNIKYDFGHAKTYYKNYLKRLNNTLEDANKYGFPADKAFILEDINRRIQYINQILILIEEGKFPYIFFNLMRNIFAHGWVNINNGNLKLYDKDVKRYYYRYSKSKKTWEEKEIDEDAVILNMEMPFDIFMDMIKDITSEYSYKLEIPENDVTLK